jgi:hypothetical protein
MSATPTHFRRALPFIVKFIARLLRIQRFHSTANGQACKHGTAKIVPFIYWVRSGGRGRSPSRDPVGTRKSPDWHPAAEQRYQKSACRRNRFLDPALVQLKKIRRFSDFEKDSYQGTALAMPKKVRIGASL